MPLPIVAVFHDLPVPRVTNAHTRHALVDIRAIAVGAIIRGVRGWEPIAPDGRPTDAFFRRFLSPKHGLPTHDPFDRVFTRRRPAAFADRFGRWMAAACDGTGWTPIARDGTSVRRATRATRADAATGCRHVVRAWATANRRTLGPVVVPDGTGAIGVIPEWLRVLDRTGAIVALDPAGCQTGNVRWIRDGNGQDLPTVTGNPPTLPAAVAAVFARAAAAGFADIRSDHPTTRADGHGRSEVRSVAVIDDPKGLPPGWRDPAAVVSVLRERVVKGEATTTVRDDRSRRAGTAEAFAARIRGHSGIGNGRHRVLDVASREDACRTCDRNAGANLALRRRVAVSLLERVKAKGSIETRRRMAAWDDEFLREVLQGFPATQVRKPWATTHPTQ
jgi:predicted transposase YbfD/YdcC